MTLRARLSVGIVAIAALLTIPLIVSLDAIKRLHDVTTHLRESEFAGSLLIGRVREQLDDLRRSEDALLIVRTEASRDRMAHALDRVTAAADSMRGFGLSTYATQISQDLAEIGQLAPFEASAALADSTSRADTLSTRIRPALERIDHGVAAAERALRDRTSERVEGATAESERAREVAVLTFSLTAGIAGIIGILLTRSISRPVVKLERGMEAVAGGDFDHRLEIRADRDDEFGRLAVSFRSMAEQLAQLDKLKAEFVSIASHELKTPINVIGGYLQLLADGIYGQLTDKQREVCGTLESQVDSLSRLVQQLLDVSRFEAGAGKLDLRPVELVPFLGELETAFDVLARQRGVGFHVEKDAAIPPVVIWDSDRMNEVLGNLLSNAFKFTDRGGRVDLLVSADDDLVQMEVRDTGAGIPATQLSSIFQKFFQADNQAQASAKGTGLGLHIAKQIVDAHGGTIVVDSVPGSGTAFLITLPSRVSSVRRATVKPRELSEVGA